MPRIPNAIQTRRANAFIQAFRVLIALALAAPAFAQTTTPGADRPAGTPPRQKQMEPRAIGADPMAGRPEVEALMRKVKTVFDPIEVLSYRATLTPAGGDARVFDVTLARAQTGVWKFLIVPILADGAALPAGAASRLAFDSSSVRALRDDEKAVFERTFTSRDPAVFEAFLAEHGAAGVVIWDFLETGNPLGNAGRAAAASVQPRQVINSRASSLLFVADMPGVYVPDAFAAETATRYTIADDTSLPFRIERLKPTLQGGRATDVSRTLTIDVWRTNRSVPPVEFAVNVPDGYRVRAAPAKQAQNPPADAATPAPGAKKPDGGSPARRADAKGLRVGGPAPAFSLKTPSGETRTLADYRGRIVLLDFWGTWCPPCRAAMPAMQRLHEKYKDRGLSVVGMNVERSKTADPVKFKKDNGYTYDLLLNAEAVTRAYQIRGYPTFILLDREGVVLWSDVGWSPQFESQLDEMIEKQLN